ncbi:hypothetical protein Tco_0505507 [Tanacetum coccineum]
MALLGTLHSFRSPRSETTIPLNQREIHTHKPGRLYRKVFIDSTTKVDSEPPNGSNDDITNPYECNQTLYVSAGIQRNSNLMNIHQMTLDHSSSSLGPHCLMMSVHISSGLVLHLDDRSLLHDNIVPKPDLALELGKSISLTEAEEEAVAREVHATHARIVSRPDPEPVQEDQTGSNSENYIVVSCWTNPAHMDDEFLASVNPKVHETLKLHNVTTCPSAGSNQGRSAKRRRPESAASGSAQPPSKDDHQSSKKPRESDASVSKQHPALTLTGWQIIDTRDDVVNSLMHMLPNNIQIIDTNSFIVLKKRSSDSSKKLKGIQTLTPAEQEAADIMKALKESKKMSKRQPGTGGSNEGTGNILGVPDESTIISRASSEGTGSKPGVPDEEKLIL